MKIIKNFGSMVFRQKVTPFYPDSQITPKEKKHIKGDIMNEDLKSFIIILLIVSILFEIILMGIGYIWADEIKCNLLWCEFTKTNQDTTINSIINITRSQECYMNGNPINCSELKEITKEWNYE